MARDIIPPRHLGDGVYVHDEGYGINIAVNHHENKVVFLEPEVIRAFIDYAKETKMIE